MGCKIIGSGKALPELAVTNDELADIVDTNDEWIVSRTGISSRRIAIDETSCDLGERAAQAALKKAGVAADDIDLLVCATITPDAIIPSEACLLKVRLGLSNAVAFDLNAACTGCIYGLVVASNMIEVSQRSVATAQERGCLPSCNVMRRALVVGVDRLSRITDWTDRSTCVLFGDGAGAVVLEWDDDAPGILSSFLENIDDDTLSLACAHLYDMENFPFGEDQMTHTGRTESQVSKVADKYDKRFKEAQEVGQDTTLIKNETLFEYPFMSMQGKHIFKDATYAMVKAINAVVERAGVSLDDVACIVSHQANERILRYAAKKIGKPIDLFQISIAHVGNTSASSVLMAFDDAYEAGRIKSGDKVILIGFGGGLTAGALLVEV